MAAARIGDNLSVVERPDGEDAVVPVPYPKKFREDVVRVPRNRDPKTMPTGWLKNSDAEEGVKPGMRTRRTKFVS